MKTFHAPLLISTLTCCLAGPLLQAQEFRPPPPGTPPGDRPEAPFEKDMERRGAPSSWERDGQRGEGKRRRDGRRPGGRGMKLDGKFTDKWIGLLEQQDPELAAEMKKQRQENPEAFHQMLRQRLSERRAEAFLKHAPDIQKIVQELPPEQRKKMVAFIGKATSRLLDPERRSHERPSRPIEEALAPLRERFLQSNNPEEQKEIRKELKAHISKAYQARRKERLNMLQQMEKEITRLKASITDNDENRDEIIRQRLEVLLSPQGAERLERPNRRP